MLSQKVLYLVNDGLHELLDCYYCESCNQLISQEEVRLEVDTYFCPSCLENIPSSEAFSKNFKCTNCFSCPRCMATISTNKTDIKCEGSSNEEFGRKLYSCGYCYFSFEAKDKLSNAEHDAILRPNNPLSHLEFEYLSTIVRNLRNLLDKKKIECPQNSYEKKQDPQSKIQEMEGDTSHSIKKLMAKNLWNNEETKILVNIKEISQYFEKNNLSLKQYLNNPEIINTVYLFSSSNSTFSDILFPLRRRMCVQISKRCSSCKRLVIKPQLNPLSHPPYRVNLTANLFLPNFKIVSVRENSSQNQSYTRIITFKIENLMDRSIRVDILPENDQNQQLSIKNSGVYSIFQIEPKSFNIDPKWDPTLEHQNQNTNLFREKIDRNKKYVDIYLLENISNIKEMELELGVVSNFQSPTGNDSTIQFKIFCKLLDPSLDNY
ncbi:dynactin subunit 4 isoform X2 [Cryptosporidium felis]|nr:dynactin subunit 4 isoform X2 [Cryptosporidium felis]